jgi:hypothetical protein
MRRLLISFTSTLLVAMARAQEVPVGKGDSAAEKAAQAMAAMDEIVAKPASNEAAPKVASDVKTLKAPKAPKPEEEADEPVAGNPPLLPASEAGGSRGMGMLSRARLDMMIPAGRSHRGVHYPMYRPPDGERVPVTPGAGPIIGIKASLDSLFESELVTRLDEDHVQFDRAKWVQYDTKPAADGSSLPKMKLEIERGVYDLKNDILMTNQPVRIENQQFVIEGDAMLHDRASGLTRLTGRVKMTFFNEDPDPVPVSTPSTPAPAVSPPAPSPPPTR